ncbi:MAG TPA: ELWxxDGT repeat protein [Chitinispirillaceae bacterium]|nr:ELWxxDGT repeat protein [Chitinispirillaceae bacterium]
MNFRKTALIFLLFVLPIAGAYEVIPTPILYLSSITSVSDKLHINGYYNGYYGSYYIMNADHSVNLIQLGATGNIGPRNFMEMDGSVYYEGNDLSVGDDDVDFQLWRTDGTAAGTVKIVDSPMNGAIKVGSTIYFRRFTPATGIELWSYTSADGAKMVSDINPGPNSSYPDNMVEFNNKLVFFAYTDALGYELWITDGTSSGTTLIKDCNPGAAHGQIYTGTTYTSGGNNHPYLIVQNHYSPIVYKNKLYFFASDGINGYELWSTDGTTAGTQMVYDINPGTGNSLFPRDYAYIFGDGPQFTVLNDDLFFIAYDPTNGFEPRKITNNSGVVELLMDIYPGNTDSQIRKIVNFNGALYFGANDGVNGHELWRTAGTTATTNMFIDICNHPLYDEPYYEVHIKDIVLHGDALFFCATEAIDYEDCSGAVCVPSYQLNDYLYRTDGTVAGTSKLVLASQDTYKRNHFLTSHYDGVYFINYLSPSTFQFIRYYEPSSPPSFTSTPVTSGTVGSLYQYTATATSSGSGSIRIEAIVKPDWATITTNETSRTAILEGTPTVPGTYPVILTARTAYGESVTQTYTLTVSDAEIIRVSAFMRDEGIDEGNISKPRIYVKNLGTHTVSDLTVEYYFTSENGKTPIVDDYYTPKSSIQLISLGNDNYKIVYNFTGYSVDPDSALPNFGGNVVGIRYSDWSYVNKTNDHSNSLSRIFSENNRICVYSSTGDLLWGTPLNTNLPPVADAGDNISVIDYDGGGEMIQLDGTRSSDPDGSIVTYEWITSGSVIATGSQPMVLFAQGLHTITLRVTDNAGQSSTDEVSVVVSAPGGSVSFTVSPVNVPVNTPITVTWQVPSSLNGSTVRILLQRAWDILPWSISGTAGNHTLVFWEWNKYFFGGSGPWEMKFEVNGVIVKEDTVRFLY